MVHEAQRCLDFIQQAFHTEAPGDVMRTPEGQIAHAEVQVGDSRIMLTEASAGCPAIPTMLYVYLDDPDQVYERGLAAGATSAQPPEDSFWGDRTASFIDPTGNQWWIAQRKENLTVAQLQERMASAQS